jgi:hypothetical protein
VLLYPDCGTCASQREYGTADAGFWRVREHGRGNSLRECGSRLLEFPTLFVAPAETTERAQDGCSRASLGLSTRVYVLARAVGGSLCAVGGGGELRVTAGGGG